MIAHSPLPGQGEPRGLGTALPKLHLIEFGGDLKEWCKFHDFFMATVHHNKSVPDIQKFIYLRSCLKGEALSHIASLPLSAANYIVAWDQLESIYNDTTALAEAYLEALSELPTVSRDSKSLRSFASSVVEFTGALRALGHKVDEWALVIIFLLKRKLNAGLRERWKESSMDRSIIEPDIDSFVKFLQKQAKLSEAAQPSQGETTSRKSSDTPGVKSQKVVKPPSTFVTSTDKPPKKSTSEGVKCVCCGAHHLTTNCNRFLKMDPRARYKVIKEKRRCMLCFQGHFMSRCPSKSVCNVCKGTHHSLLHFQLNNNRSDSRRPADTPTYNPPSDNKLSPSTSQSRTPEPLVAAVQTALPVAASTVLLSTAVVSVQNQHGKYIRIKVLIDCASQGTFISSACLHRLGLKSIPNQVPVFGLAHTQLGLSSGSVMCALKTGKSLKLDVNALVVDEITYSPGRDIEMRHWPHLIGLKLADPLYYKSQPIDLLLGAEWYAHIMIGNPIVGPTGTPSAIETCWGYVLVGRVEAPSSGIQSFCLNTSEPLEELIRKFWTVEEPPNYAISAPEDEFCEGHYQETVQRDRSGRYIVKLPFRPNAAILGNSRAAALRRFYLLERKLEKNEGLRKKYNTFMQDYHDQGHMIRATTLPEKDVHKSYYIPHHCIYRGELELARFRVVFDASMATQPSLATNPTVAGSVANRGPSLNEVLFVGPKLQLEITKILISFRAHSVVLVADIRQMYRNISINPKNYDFQRIFWRFHPSSELQEYWLTTVTYGVTSSPFLAVRSLRQLVSDEGSQFSEASRAILENTYMDDVVVSLSSVESALNMKRELVGLMEKGCFELRKWMSNCPEILDTIPPEHRALKSDMFTFDEYEEASTKILGLVWEPGKDILTFRVSLEEKEITKRSILSELARLYDPLGYICPVTFLGKWLIQYLWQLGLGWDDVPPDNVKDRWEEFRLGLPLLTSYSIPRCLYLDGAQVIQLHGFSDSSERGYAAVVYVRAVQVTGEIVISLVLAKSRVAPLKKITLPRLELCGAVLMADLLSYVQNALRQQCTISDIFAWTDSTVALSWIHSSPHRWKTFIANRISHIQELVPPTCFRYVPSTSNPADVASRGLLPRELVESEIWQTGPSWLREDSDKWPKLVNSSKGSNTDDEIEARVVSLATSVEVEPIEQCLAKYSSYCRILNVIAYCFRFFFNTRNTQNRRRGMITVSELRTAETALIKFVQSKEFKEDLKALEKGSECSTRLRNLKPFIDQSGVLRVGGRLRHSNLAYDVRHPILLPKSNNLTNLVISHYHKVYLHPGPLTLHNIIREKYWIVAGRDVIRRQVTNCLQCFRYRPKAVQPCMGDIPSCRLQEIKPFLSTGVDYGGPFFIKLSKLRNSKIGKAYVCLFICLATRAIHLELASELTTDAFLAALRRFISRRGPVHEIRSDCGTNFVGAKRRLEEWARYVSSEEHTSKVSQELSQKGISFKLNPPYSPHMGGGWERGIQSVKRNLVVAIGEQVLTYEELYTVLTQIEATLNSRPLIPLSNDPEDLSALSPSHFLVQGPVSSAQPLIGEPVGEDLRCRWNLLQQIAKSFWHRWRKEYLNTLQSRSKWNKEASNLEVGSLVLIKEDNLPPLKWRLGRIIKVFPGKDNTVRVAEVKTILGVITRPAVKLCPLPNQI